MFSNEEGQFVEVQAEFPWGFESVETIKLLPKAWQEVCITLLKIVIKI